MEKINNLKEIDEYIHEKIHKDINSSQYKSLVKILKFIRIIQFIGLFLFSIVLQSLVIFVLSILFVIIISYLIYTIKNMKEQYLNKEYTIKEEIVFDRYEEAITNRYNDSFSTTINYYLVTMNRDNEFYLRQYTENFYKECKLGNNIYVVILDSKNDISCYLQGKIDKQGFEKAYKQNTGKEHKSFLVSYAYKK